MSKTNTEITYCSFHYSVIPFEAKAAVLRNIRKNFAHLLPSPWWLIDPANPANNVYVSGMSGKRKDIGWQIFAEKVESIDLTIDVQQMLKQAKK